MYKCAGEMNRRHCGWAGQDRGPSSIFGLSNFDTIIPSSTLKIVIVTEIFNLFLYVLNVGSFK